MPTTPGVYGSNAGDFNNAYAAADTAQQANLANTNAWQQGRNAYATTIAQQTEAAGRQAADLQARDSRRENAFAQARSGNVHGSVDLSNQTRINATQQVGNLQAQMQGLQAGINQQQVDADHAAFMREQGLGFYDGAFRTGQMQAQNQQTTGSMAYDWANRDYQTQMGLKSELAGIQGAFTGSQIGGALSAVGSAYGHHLGSQNTSSTLGGSTGDGSGGATPHDTATMTAWQNSQH